MASIGELLGSAARDQVESLVREPGKQAGPWAPLATLAPSPKAVAESSPPFRPKRGKTQRRRAKSKTWRLDVSERGLEALTAAIRLGPRAGLTESVARQRRKSYLKHARDARQIPRLAARAKAVERALLDLDLHRLPWEVFTSSDRVPSMNRPQGARAGPTDERIAGLSRAMKPPRALPKTTFGPDSPMFYTDPTNSK